MVTPQSWQGSSGVGIAGQVEPTDGTAGSCTGELTNTATR